MKNCLRTLCLATVLMICCTAETTSALDWPFKFGFRLGFNVTVLPAANDASAALGLAVATNVSRNDKGHTLIVTGTITNTSDEVRDNIRMGFAVTSYGEIGTDRKTAVVEPASLPPGGVATFTMHIMQGGKKPQYAFYAVTAGVSVSSEF